MKIAITSGKGGTGKTTLSTALFHYLSEFGREPAQLVDCDVEEPDCHLFLPSSLMGEERVHISLPRIQTDACTFCGACRSHCAFHAIVMLPAASFIEVVGEQCHACGVCTYLCPEHAIVEEEHEIGRISRFRYRRDHDFLEGRLRVGSTLQTRLIRELLQGTGREGTILLDAPPGASCPVVSVIREADYVLMVAEASPFGLNDLAILAETVVQAGKPHGVVINKAGQDFPDLREWLDKKQIPVLAEIPFRKDYARALSDGHVLTESYPEIRDTVSRIFESIRG